MNARRLLPIHIVASLLLGIVSCGWPWPFDDPYDPHRCDPPCEGKEKCIEGQCQIPPDGGIKWENNLCKPNQ